MSKLSPQHFCTTGIAHHMTLTFPTRSTGMPVSGSKCKSRWEAGPRCCTDHPLVGSLISSNTWPRGMSVTSLSPTEVMREPTQQTPAAGEPSCTRTTRGGCSHAIEAPPRTSTPTPDAVCFAAVLGALRASRATASRNSDIAKALCRSVLSLRSFGPSSLGTSSTLCSCSSSCSSDFSPMELFNMCGRVSQACFNSDGSMRSRSSKSITAFSSPASLRQLSKSRCIFPWDHSKVTSPSQDAISRSTSRRLFPATACPSTAATQSPSRTPMLAAADPVATRSTVGKGSHFTSAPASSSRCLLSAKAREESFNAASASRRAAARKARRAGVPSDSRPALWPVSSSSSRMLPRPEPPLARPGGSCGAGPVSWTGCCARWSSLQMSLQRCTMKNWSMPFVLRFPNPYVSSSEWICGSVSMCCTPCMSVTMSSPCM
mmetsp:Transcript_59431/g.191234  ORF Transcript_59431/g.191234 Transcript_59431/m.191234 type:complete len:431 (+) Transcript_59431:1843-3135(+)